MMPDLNKILAWENGEMDHEQTIVFFQELIDSGLVWRLQGTYGRTARALIDDGLCVDKVSN